MAPPLSVLFVDDEPKLLEGLRRSLRSRRGTWDMRFVDGGQAALTALAETAFDVVVTDMRMPGIDGAAVLAAARTLRPGAVRIVLSGQTSGVEGLRALPAAHRFLGKPCETGLLVETLERAETLLASLPNATLRGWAGNLEALPVTANVHADLVRVVADPFATPPDVAAAVLRDPGAAAKLVQLAHSGFLGTPRRLETVADAIAFLGVRTVQTLIATLPVAPADSLASRIAEDGTRTAHICAALVASDDRDRAALAGLMHDVGQLVILAHAPESLARIEEEASRRGIAVDVVERAVLGVSHAEIGAYLLSLWGYAPDLVEAVRFHHRPSRAGPPEMDLAGALHVAAAFSSEKEGAVDLEWALRAGVAHRLDALRERARTAMA